MKAKRSRLAAALRNPRIKKVKLDFYKTRAKCPKCGTDSRMHSTKNKKVIGLNATLYLIRYSMHFCLLHRKHFQNLPEEYRLRYYTLSLRDKVLDEAKVVGVPNGEGSLRKLRESMSAEHKVHIPETTLHDWLVVDAAPVPVH